MKKTHKNFRVDYSSAIKSLGIGDEEFESLKDIQAELERQVERERKSASEYPDSYRLADIMTSVSGNNYRSGDADGARVMTHEDYMRLIVAETKIPEYGKHPRQTYHVDPRPAAVYNVKGVGENPVSVRESVISADGNSVARIEYSDTTLSGSVTRFFDQWFPQHALLKPDRKYRRRVASSAAGIAWVMIFAFVIALPITLGVLKSEAGSNLSEKRQELAALESMEARLEAEYESGLDLREIESIAINELGMIRLNQSTLRVLRLNETDTIESFSDSKEESIVPALLSALGIRVGNE